jgi:hypothetical protein
MGHHCRICKQERPNEQFSGSGYKIRICKRCNTTPKRERQVIEGMDDIFRFLRQSHISDRNVARAWKNGEVRRSPGRQPGSNRFENCEGEALQDPQDQISCAEPSGSPGRIERHWPCIASTPTEYWCRPVEIPGLRLPGGGARGWNKGESPRGVSPRGARRTVRETLASYGSHRGATARNEPVGKEFWRTTGDRRQPAPCTMGMIA